MAGTRPLRSRRSTRRWRCGEARRWRIWATGRSRRARSRGPRSCGFRRSRVREGQALGPAAAALSSLELPPSARTAAFVSTRGGDDVLHLARSHDADLLLLAAGAGLPADVLDRSPADVGLVFAPAGGRGGARGGGGLGPVRRGGPGRGGV